MIAAKNEPYYPGNSQPLLAFRLTHEEMVAKFGVCHRVAGKDDDEPGPVEYWSFRFPCGLAVFIAYHFGHPGGAAAEVFADATEIEHILHHLSLEDCVCWRLDRDDADYYRATYGEPGQVVVMRQDDHGNRVEISAHPTRRAALCIQQQLEAAGHKQTYWVE